MTGDAVSPQGVLSALVKSQGDRDLILISRGITRKLHHDLSLLIAKEKKNNKVTVFLTTLGGDPDGGYRIARCLQHHYEHIRLIVPSHCKSAGTLIAIGAHELVIGDLGELGPLDVQVLKSSELEERSSGLDIVQALEAAQTHARQAFHSTLVEIRQGGRLSTKLAGEFAATVAIGVAAPLYSQIDPNRLGEMQRAMRIAHEYGKRLDQTSQSMRNGALDNLIAGYPSHSFVIDRKEASSLFSSVRSPTKEEKEFCDLVWKHLGTQSETGPLFIEDESSTTQGEQHDGTIEGTGDEQPDAYTAADDPVQDPAASDEPGK
ncbi:SDH family Clp fold serine proteinase [Massilia timonae]|uniref:SppA protein n=1 Tax=Massilia timonae CCUG 45783 TaxID=883126 RepID=K9DXY3_9BURK|nr:hypothetical protein [Massilia timonae]EKU83472.1 hypothetical protein HMPREF9710_01345 [Massilia timonae CCUG 45783]